MPQHSCGGEMYVHSLAKHLMRQGHQVRVLLHQANTYKITSMYNFEGVDVFPPGCNEQLVLWSHIMLTHLEFCHWTVNMGRIYKKPVVFISHNTHFDAYTTITDNPDVGVIYNSDAMKAISPFTNPSIVLHPALDSNKVTIPTGDYITLINCNENKGGKIFSRVAQAMPDRKFLAVKGSYDEQFIPDLPNVTVRENSPDIVPVYQMTRILLMPSRYESWGMTATEAMACGIPVIACPTFGLKENCAEAGIFIPEREELIQTPEWDTIDDGETYDIKPILAAIKKLDNKKAYEKQRLLCLKRAEELNPEKELAACEEFLVNLTQAMAE